MLWAVRRDSALFWGIVKLIIRILTALALAVLSAASIRVGSREGTLPTRGGWRPVDPDS